MARRRLPPFEIEIDTLAPRGLGEGMAPDGHRMRVRNGVPGARVHVVPAGRRKGIWTGRKVRTVRPPAEGVVPGCAVFDRCGGCQLQELGLSAQRRHKHEMALGMVRAGLGTDLDGVVVHEVQGADAAYGYRNRIELSFGVRRWLTEADQVAGLPHGGRFVGMHPPGRFDRIVDSERCELASDGMNRVLAIVREHALHEEAPPPRDVRTHEGFWRHVRVRESVGADERLLTLFTTSPRSDADDAWVERVAEAALAEVVGVVWCVDDGVADVARGDVRRVWGRDHLVEHLTLPGDTTTRHFRLSPSSFFQTNTHGAEVLYGCIAEAVGAGGTLLDLYCGTGSIGIALADRVERVIGVEEVASAVEDAGRNAAANGVEATYQCAKVEDVVHELPLDARIVVDPPRAGLHPRVAKALAGAQAEALVYVACHPASLGRDAAILAEGGWRLTELWTVDLFPQTGHIEMVGRFER